MGLDNSAQRLFEILTLARAAKSDQAAREVWRALLGATGDAQLLDRLGKVMALPQTILTEIEERHPGMATHHQHWVSQISAAFYQHSLESQWGNFRGTLSPQLLSSIAIAATTLAGPNSRLKMDEESSNKIWAAIGELGELVVQSTLDEKLKRYLLRQVSRLREAMEEYFITGGEPVVELIESTLGHIGTREEGRKAAKTQEGLRIVDALAVVADAVTVAGGLPPLLTAAGVTFVELAKYAADA